MSQLHVSVLLPVRGLMPSLKRAQSLRIAVMSALFPYTRTWRFVWTEVNVETCGETVLRLESLTPAPGSVVPKDFDAIRLQDSLNMKNLPIDVLLVGK